MKVVEKPAPPPSKTGKPKQLIMDVSRDVVNNLIIEKIKTEEKLMDLKREMERREEEVQVKNYSFPVADSNLKIEAHVTKMVIKESDIGKIKWPLTKTSLAEFDQLRKKEEVPVMEEK